MIKLFLDGITNTLLVVLAGDLLYLYYNGAWYDSNKIILILEIVLLWMIIALGLIRFYLQIRCSKRKK